MTAVTEQEFLEWKQHVVTSKLFEVLRKERATMAQGVIYGDFENEEEVKGRCKAIDRLVDMDYEDLYE